MAYLLDTSILGRLANTADSHYSVATQAIVKLHRSGEILHVTPQNLIEFRSIATRPVAANGLGLSPAKTEEQAAAFEAVFPLLADTPDIFSAWKTLVAALGIVSKQVHDARLVAVCHAHGITHLLTFNTKHFARMATYGPGVIIVDPASA